LSIFQEVEKPLRDTKYLQVTVQRYQCQTCKHTFRVYPQGVGADQTSHRVKVLAVVFYLLGLSYGLTAIALETLKIYLCKSRVYEAVQSAELKDAELSKLRLPQKAKILTSGPNLLSISYHEQWLPVNLLIGDLSQLILQGADLSSSDMDTLQSWLEPIAKATNCELLVTD
jgi:hypothetical protein